VVAKLTAATATIAMPRYLKIIRVVLQRLLENKAHVQKRFPMFGTVAVFEEPNWAR